MVGLCVCLLDECTIELVGLVLLSLALSLSLCLNVIFCFRGRAIFCRGMVIKSITLAYCFAFFKMWPPLVLNCTSFSFYKDNRVFCKLLNILLIQTQTSAATHTPMKKKGMLFFFFLFNMCACQPIIVLVRYILFSKS